MSNVILSPSRTASQIGLPLVPLTALQTKRADHVSLPPAVAVCSSMTLPAAIPDAVAAPALDTIVASCDGWKSQPLLQTVLDAAGTVTSVEDEPPVGVSVTAADSDGLHYFCG